jgi:molybdopterin/thiamine biosynthesis adenylyltransferase
MATPLQHESQYRGADAVTSRASKIIAICGCGALGSNLAENLARQGWTRLILIDKDRVEAHNLGNQAYSHTDVGRFKAAALSDKLFNIMRFDLPSSTGELNQYNVRKLLREANLVVDCFDNSASRQVVQTECRRAKLDCLHVGLAEGYGEVIWDQSYQVPSDVDQGNGAPCDQPLARNLVVLTVIVACETIASWQDGKRRSFTVTLRDLKIEEVDALP